MVLFGIGGSTAVTSARSTLRQAVLADRGGLDLFSVSDHPYNADRLDAYAEIGVVLGRTERISGLVSVTNLPTRPAPMLARAVTSLSALSGGGSCSGWASAGSGTTSRGSA